MARLDQLTDNFMQSFLRNNPKSLVDSNGYLRREYEAELARRVAYVPPSPANSVPDPRSYPQFENIPFESVESALDFELTGTACIGGPEPVQQVETPIVPQDAVRPEITAHAKASIEQNRELLAKLAEPTPIEIEAALDTVPSYDEYEAAVPEGIETPAGRPTTDLAEIEQEFAAQPVLGEDQKYAVEPPEPIRTDAEDVNLASEPETQEPKA